MEGRVMKPIADVLRDMHWPDQLRDLASRVDRNIPDRLAPEEFHAEKSEIANTLRKIARQASAERRQE